MKNIMTSCLLISTLFISCGGREEEGSENNTSTPTNFSLVASKTQASVGVNFQFSFQGTLPSSITNINWDFGDGATYFGNSDSSPVYHAYQNAGNYMVKAKILYDNGKITEKSIIISSVNNNIMILNQIAVTNIAKTTKQAWTLTGSGGVWYSFVGDWDETENHNTFLADRYADVYVEFYKIVDVPNPNNPHVLLQDSEQFLYKTGIASNQQGMIFNLPTSNVSFSSDAIKNIRVKIMDSDAVLSLKENGNPDEAIETRDLQISQFLTGNGTLPISGLANFTITYQK